MKRFLSSLAAAAFLALTSLSAPAADGGAASNAPNLEERTVTLNNGAVMPTVGLGTALQSNEETAESVYVALKNGYRLLDTAGIYGNEVGVGQGLKRAIAEGIVKREDVFITTKLWPDHFNIESVDESLKRLDVAYVDLLLLHWPFGDNVQGYKVLEQALAEGKTRTIGLSNFSQETIEDLLKQFKTKPAVVQLETHIFNQQNEMREYLKKYGAFVMSWYPFGGRDNVKLVLENETVVNIAKAHNKSAAQVVLRWHLQSGCVVIPGASNPDYIKENIDIFDFELSEEEMAQIRALNQDKAFYDLRRGR